MGMFSEFDGTIPALKCWLYWCISNITHVMNSFLLLQCAEHVFTYSFSSMIYMHLPQGRHALLLMFTLLSTLCFTCVHLKANTFLYLFKPIVRQLYSLAFHSEIQHSYF